MIICMLLALLKILFRFPKYVNLMVCPLSFFPWQIQIKDLRTWRMMPPGNNEDNLYKLLYFHLSGQINHAMKSPPTELWHHQLGHLDSRVVCHVLKHQSLPFVPSHNKWLDCQANKTHKLFFYQVQFVKFKSFGYCLFWWMVFHSSQFNKWIFILCFFHWSFLKICVVISNETQIRCLCQFSSF